MVKKILWRAVTLYLAVGLVSGIAMQAAVPAMNAYGVAYYALTWPAQIYCAPPEDGCNVAPGHDWGAFMFSFPETNAND